MKRSPTLRWPSLLALACGLVLAGCGDDDPATAPTPQPDPLPAGTPQNDTPANTMIRFERAYENQVLASYVALLAADFRYTFSNQSDPVLVTQYGDTWGVSTDSLSSAHLFAGFTNDQGSYVAGASNIMLSLPGISILNDPDHADSAAHYRLASVPAISLLLDIPGTDGYEIAAPHDFHLVRGDAAVLRSGQPADSTRWYVRRQVDKSPALAITPGLLAPARVLPAETSTWGSIKAQYH